MPLLMTISKLEPNPGTHNAPCVCTDPEVEVLRTLIAGGMDQLDASRRLWGTAVPYADLEAFRAWIRTEFITRFPDLKLPEMDA